jgi:hypothetical protein
LKPVCAREPYVVVSHDEPRKYVLLKWKSFRISIDDIKTMHAEVLDYVIRNNCEFYIADTADTTDALSPEIILWWRTVWIQELIKAKIKAIITVVPRTMHSEHINNEWQSGKYDTISLVNVENIDEAEELISAMNLIAE